MAKQRGTSEFSLCSPLRTCFVYHLNVIWVRNDVILLMRRAKPCLCVSWFVQLVSYCLFLYKKLICCMCHSKTFPASSPRIYHTSIFGYVYSHFKSIAREENALNYHFCEFFSNPEMKLTPLISPCVEILFFFLLWVNLYISEIPHKLIKRSCNLT